MMKAAALRMQSRWQMAQETMQLSAPCPVTDVSDKAQSVCRQQLRDHSARRRDAKGELSIRLKDTKASHKMVMKKENVKGRTRLRLKGPKKVVNPARTNSLPIT